MARLSDIVNYANGYLQVDRFDDYCPNGLQVQGRDEVSKIVSGVTASRQLIDRAIAESADMLLVHHGYFWRGEDPSITGMKRERIVALLDRGISLVAYHLPLDQHRVCGNNAQLAAKLGWKIDEEVLQGDGPLRLVCTATLSQPTSGDALAKLLQERLARQPLHIAVERTIRRVAWCTGGAQGYLLQALDLGADAYISGEISEQTVHEARENNIHYYAAGHHATERYGPAALGEHLAERFSIGHVFVDCDNPV